MRKNVLKSVVFICVVWLGVSSCTEPKETSYELAVRVLKDSTLLIANEIISAPPITVTASVCPRSTGGIHDFYSEGDYWWPDTTNPDGPYIRKDGLTNPDNFTAHRKALIRLSEIVGNLTSAYLITDDAVYAEAANKHLHAWFVEEETRMNPNLLYAQAIQGRHTGRGIGIIDAIHFMEVVQSILILEQNQKIAQAEMQALRAWFSEFLHWLTTHPYGQDEMVHPNNHGTCWNMQVGLYALFTQNDSILAFCRDNFQQTLLPNQMAKDGSFPLELARTKPYGYSLFNLDAMVMNCLILSGDSHNLWEFRTPEGIGVQDGLDYMDAYVANKTSWPLPPDVMYWDNWPVAHPAFLLAGTYFDRTDWIDLWINNKHFLEVEEVRRNMPIRHPLLWLWSKSK
ncbi:MAG: alginate lyase family protein [Bacteroidota bacterium]